MHWRALAKATLRSEGIDGILMEDVPDQGDEARYPDQKFKRLLDTFDLNAVIVVWPRGAKMQTVFIELVILAQRGLDGKTLPLYYLAHPKAASHQNGRFIIHERGGRSTYINGAERLAPTLHPWQRPTELQTATQRCANEIKGAS